MATKTTKQPAEPKGKQPAKATKPASVEPAVNDGIGVKELATALGRNPKSVRASIRRIMGGPQVGQGKRYRWESETDPAYVDLLNKLKGADEKADA